jgi:Flp pilus assembly protein TadD
MEILAGMLMSLGNHVEAEHFHRYILRTLSKILGAHHPSVLTSMINLALVLLLQQRHCEPERPARQVLEHSHQHIETLTTVNNLALVLNAQGRNKEAEAHIRQALKGFRYRCGKRHPNTLTSMANLAVICRDQGSFTEAERLLRESLRWCKSSLARTIHPR